MTKKLFPIFILFCVMIGVKAENVNYFVIGSTAAPFQIEENGKNHRGIITDIVNEVFQGLRKYEIVTHTLPFKRYIKELEKQESWLTYGSDSWTGPQSWNITQEGLFEVNHVFLTKKGIRFNKVSDLFNKRIVLITGFEYPELDQYIKSGRIKTMRVANHEAAIKAIQKDRGLAFPEMEIRIKYHLKTMGMNFDDFSFSTIKDVLKGYKINLAFSRNFNRKLQLKIEKSLRAMKKLGRIDKIIAKYSER